MGELNDNSKKGIIPRSFDYIFDKINNIQNQNNNIKFNVNIAFLQIYLETIQDLFEPNNQVTLREDKEKGLYIDNCLWIKVKNSKECFQAFQIGNENRVTAFTNLNAKSNRSHSILIIQIEKKIIENNGSNDINSLIEGNLYIVDLAGSERVNKSKIKDIRLEEAKKINYSLSVLGNCIQNLINKSNYIPYRDSKLTRMLKESLGGNAKTSFIITISPSNYNLEESVSSLNFGQRAMKVKNKSKINIRNDYESICSSLQEKYDQLIEKYSILEMNYYKICEENNQLKNGEVYVTLQRKSIQNQFNKSNNDYQSELKKLENYYEEVIKNKELENNKYLEEVDKALINKEEEIEKILKEIDDIKNINKNLVETIQDISKENNDLKHTCSDLLSQKEEFIKEIKSLKELQMKNDINKIIKENEQKDKDYINRINNLENGIKLYEKQISESKFNSHVTNSEYKRLLYSTNNNNKSLNKYLNNFDSDIKIISSFINDFKKISNFLDNNLFSSNNFRIDDSKIKNLVDIIRDKIENFNNQYKLKYNPNQEEINKLQELINDNKKNIYNIITLFNKIILKILKISNNNKKNDDTNINTQNENLYKKKILDIINNNINNLSLTFDNEDLRKELNYLYNNYNNMSYLKLLKQISEIFENIILKIKYYNKQKEVEIENYKEKIFYFIKEIDNYKRYFNDKEQNSNCNTFLNNQLILKNEEIIRLNKIIDSYFIK